jgi:hypothetical protein
MEISNKFLTTDESTVINKSKRGRKKSKIDDNITNVNIDDNIDENVVEINIKDNSELEELNMDLAGKRWTQEEDEQLIKLYNIDKLDLFNICKIHKRMPGGVASRLVTLNITTERCDARNILWVSIWFNSVQINIFISYLLISLINCLIDTLALILANFVNFLSL